MSKQEKKRPRTIPDVPATPIPSEPSKEQRKSDPSPRA